jgi:ligand-binding sensor domain-containing protein
MIDSDGALWAGTNQGAAKFNGRRFEALAHLQGTNVLGIVQDKAGSYWFSGEGGLLHYTPPQSSTALGNWERFTQDNGLPSVNYYGVVKDDNGNLYFDSDGGLVRYDGQAFATWAVPNVPAGASWGRILPAPEGGALWFTDRSGCTPPDRLDLRTETWSLANLPVGCNVLAVGADRSVWLGADDGLWIISADSRQIHLSQNEGLPSDQVVEVAFAAKAAWVGTADHGLALVQDEKIAQTYNVGNAGLTSNVIRVPRATTEKRGLCLASPKAWCSSMSETSGWSPPALCGLSRRVA